MTITSSSLDDDEDVEIDCLFKKSKTIGVFSVGSTLKKSEKIND